MSKPTLADIIEANRRIGSKPVDILCGKAEEQLGRIERASVQTCVTSPPYYGLRDYGMAGQLGAEATAQEYAGSLVSILRRVRRVLKPDGTLWLVLGDSYIAKPTGGLSSKPSLMVGGRTTQEEAAKRPDKQGVGLKAKDLIGVPWRVALALQEDGWYLRSGIIWHKPNVMPSSVKDRPTTAHEYIFLLTKNARYYYDGEAVKEPLTPNTHPPGNRKAYSPDRPDGSYLRANRDEEYKKQTNRNRRSVWTVPTKPLKEAHFAAFPPDLIRPCILAGSRIGDTVLDPFSGAGTTGLVCVQENRRYIGIELNPDYVEMSERRIASAR